ncbi:MAG: WecB/TagA/CpsF family glycosyltransferase, partial [Candidatus Thiodiazotropha sp. (ex Lucinoma borealis)]|nr:WecB/TagA/CpsF family glycosyltransferase [Candidatus Thiodiazotropha sp. (ex Lucinoma borealis)]
RRAPIWMQQSGLEWFYRFLQEPRRMFRRYLPKNSSFLGELIATNKRSGAASLIHIFRSISRFYTLGTWQCQDHTLFFEPVIIDTTRFTESITI